MAATKLKLNMEEIIEFEATLNSKSKRPKDMNAPKQPSSAFMLYSNTRRPALMEANRDMRLADVSKIIGAEWKSVEAATKAKHEAEYKVAKAAYDKKMEKYMKTDEYKNHRVAMYAWRVHETKMPFRKNPDAPKRAQTAYMCFVNATRDGLMERDDMTFQTVLVEIGAQWKALSAEQRLPYEKQAEAEKKKYQAALAKYQKTQGYKEYEAAKLAYKEEMVAKRNRLLKKKKKVKKAPKRSRSTSRKARRAKKSKSRSKSRRRSKGRRVVRRRTRRARNARKPKSPKTSASSASSSASSRRRASRRSSSRSARRSSSRKERRARRKSRRAGRRRTSRRSISRSKSPRRGVKRRVKGRRARRRRRARKAKGSSGASSASDSSVAE